MVSACRRILNASTALQSGPAEPQRKLSTQARYAGAGLRGCPDPCSRGRVASSQLPSHERVQTHVQPPQTRPVPGQAGYAVTASAAVDPALAVLVAAHRLCASRSLATRARGAQPRRSRAWFGKGKERQWKSSSCKKHSAKRKMLTSGPAAPPPNQSGVSVPASVGRTFLGTAPFSEPGDALRVVPPPGAPRTACSPSRTTP